MCYVQLTRKDNRSFKNYWKAPSSEEEIRNYCLPGTQVKSCCFLGSSLDQIWQVLVPRPRISKG